MKKLLILLATGGLLQAATAAEAPSTGRSLSEMRGLLLKTDKTYSDVIGQVQAFSLQYMPTEESDRLSEFIAVQNKVRNIEGQINLRKKHSGSSRIWVANNRIKQNGDRVPEIPSVADEFLSGSEQDVALHSGELVQRSIDISLPSRGGIAFSFKRFFYSFNDYDGPLGKGWDYNYNARIIADSEKIADAKTLHLFLNGRSIEFKKTGDNWMPQPGEFYTLQISDNQIFILDAQLSRMEFEPSAESTPGAWRLKALASRHGDYKNNRLEIQYLSKSDRIDTILEPFGNQIQFAYNAEGRISQIATSLNAINYEYDANGCLTQIILPQAAINFKQTSDKQIFYDYIQKGTRFLLSGRRQNNMDSKYIISYDDYERAVNAGYKSEDLNSMWRFHYASDHTRVIMPKPNAEVTYYFSRQSTFPALPLKKEISARNAIWTFSYNSDGLPSETVLPLGEKKVYKYDSQNKNPSLRSNCTSTITIPNGSHSESTKEHLGSSITYFPQTSFPTIEEHYQVDVQGEKRVLSVQKYTYSAKDLELSSSDDNGITTRYFSNKFGETCLIMDANDRATINYYANTWPTGFSFDFEQGKIDGAGLLVRTIFDADKETLDQVCETLKIPKFIFNEITRVKPVGLNTFYAYDERGNLLRKQTGADVSYALYNRDGNILADFTTQKGLNIATLRPDQRRESILHEYFPAKGTSSASNKSTDFAGNFYLETFHYDSLGRLSSLSKTDEFFNAMKCVYRYKRYPDGRINSITDPMGMERIDQYDESTGLLQRQIARNGDSTATLTDIFKYFPSGQIKSFQNSFGGIEQFTLDGYGRIISTTLPNGLINKQKLDGIGRILEEISIRDGKIIATRRMTYNTYGLREAIWVRRLANGVDEEYESSRYAYDSVGNLLAQKNAHNAGWQYYLYDGLNRQVGMMNPSGDIAISLYDKDILVMSCQADYVSSKSYILQSSIFCHDQFGRPVTTVPLDAQNKLVADRSTISLYNAIGQLISSRQHNDTTTQISYNSLGLVTAETTVPSSATFGEKAVKIHYDYYPNGKIKSKRIDNEALAVFGTHEKASARLIPAPQETFYRYDVLTRDSSIQQPDGVIISKKYNLHSMPNEMTWTHASNPEKILRYLILTFSNMGKLESISDGQTKKILRTFSYDALGNCIQTIDNNDDGRNVSVDRDFDSTGRQIAEQVSVGTHKFPKMLISYDIANGIESLTWQNLTVKNSNNWRTQSFHRDATGKIIAVSLDNVKQPFAKWRYTGNRPIQRDIPESRMSQSYVYNALNEPVSYKMLERGNHFGELVYTYNKRGDTIFTSTQLAGEDKTPYTFAQYMEYDAFRQLVAQNGEVPIPNHNDIMARYNEIFQGKTSLQAEKTSRMVFDQATPANIWARYQGKRQSSLVPDTFSPANLIAFISPASLISPNDEKLSAKTMFELASNRETTQARLRKDNVLTAEENEYDLLGNLTKFSGSFWNGDRKLPVSWSLQFDSLGRLSKLTGTSEDDSGFIKKGELAVELSFLYDAYNRRISKTIRDYTRYKTVLSSEDVTMYIGNNQAFVLQKNDASYNLREQYLWQGDTRELLMAALPASDAEKAGSSDINRYYFQQDRGYNTICVTRVESGNIVMVSGMSYLGFGENATVAKIKEIDSSMASETSPTYSFNDRLDDNKISIWKNPSSLPQFIEIKLDATSCLSSMSIWTDDTFANEFMVFVIPPGVDSPRIDTIDKWTYQAIAKKLLCYTSSIEEGKDGIKHDSIKPITIPLRSLSGNRIVIVWEKSAKTTINVREFEIVKEPNNPGSIAFAGQWLDRESGLYYQINRYRLAGSDKFISPDPIGFLDGNNLYAYAKNNPLEWHDPDGQWAHIVLGALAGAVINSGMYGVQCWLTGEDFSWSQLAIKAGTGALAGGIAAATFGAVNPLLANAGLNATANIVISAGSAGFTGGFSSSFTDNLINTGDLGESVIEGLKGGGWGAAGGVVTGGVMSQTGASLMGTVFSGSVGGGAVGGSREAWNTWQRTGDLSEAMWAGLEGSWKGAATGAAIAGAGWGVGRASGMIKPLKGYPEHLPNPKQGVMVRTRSSAIERTYDNMPITPGYARHHIKGLSLGGRDISSNLVNVPVAGHSAAVNSANAHPGSFVNTQKMGTIFY